MRPRPGLWCGAFLLLLLGTCPARAEPIPPEETRAEFEFMAATLPDLPLETVLHGPSRDGKGTDAVLRRAADATYRREDLAALLIHQDPKVRTLAAAALFAREDPSALPLLVPLCADRSATFDASGPPAASLSSGRSTPAADRRQTVGAVVEAMLNAYLRSGGFIYGVRSVSHPGFDQYWAKRQGRAFCAGWFALRLDRAVGGLLLPAADCAETVRAVRRQLDAAPPDERAWTLLWLHGEPGSDLLATEAELVEAARGLGSDKLLEALHDRFPGDDPDVRPDGGTGWMYRRMEAFLLEHAAALFGPGDADALLDCGGRTKNATVRAGCAVAVARLRPVEAESILREAMGGFEDRRDPHQRARLAAVWYELGGDAGRSSALDWFYQGLNDRGYQLARLEFIDWLVRGPRGRMALAAVIGDPQFGGLDDEVLKKIAQTVNAWSRTPVVVEDEFKKNVVRTRDLLPEWCRKLRASVPQWNEEPAAADGGG